MSRGAEKFVMDSKDKADGGSKKKHDKKPVAFKIVPPYNMDDDEIAC